MEEKMNWLTDLWNWFLSLLGGDPVVTRPIEIIGHCFMPLFLRDLAGRIVMTWNYLSMSDAEKQNVRRQIKSGAKSGETPAICFCLSPANINGGLLPDSMSGITDAALDVLEAKCKELVADGIAVFLCLYVDDALPRWMEIEKHRAIWTRIHGRIAKYVTGYILSIETNEYANNLGQIEGCLTVIQSAMPDVYFYGTHLQWTANNGRYQWRGISSVPKNANIILAEYSYDPHQGDAIGIETFKNQCLAIQNANPGVKIVHHEYNVNAGSAKMEAQRAFLREAGVWGVAKNETPERVV
jgi:hypothetical protein